MRSQRAPTALAFHSKSTTTGRLTPSARIRSRKVDLGIDRAFAAVPTYVYGVVRQIADQLLIWLHLYLPLLV